MNVLKKIWGWLTHQKPPAPTPEGREDLLRAWLEALRNGDYPQTDGALRDKYGYCCLGVACEVSGMGRWVDDGGVTGKLRYEITPYDASTGVLPDAVRQRLGIRGTFEGYLVNLNDMGHTFPEIADVIEKEMG